MLALASTTPVRPPIVNRPTNPSANSIGALSRSDPPYAVPRWGHDPVKPRCKAYAVQGGLNHEVPQWVESLYTLVGVPMTE